MSSDHVRFGALFAEPQRNGLTRPKKVRGQGFPMVNMGELFAVPRIRNLAMDLVPVANSEQHYLLQPGDLLFARQSLVLSGAGQCSIFLGNTAPTVFESHLIRCRLDRGLANPNFYFYFFRSPAGRQVMETIVEQGAGAAGIRGSDLVNLEVPRPELRVQNAVAELLGAIDDRITLLRETNATLEAIAQALFKSWFVDFDPVRAKRDGRAPEGMDEATDALFPDSFEDSELGEVPRGWSVVALTEIADVVMGLSPKGDSYNVEGLGVPLINGPVEFGDYFPVQSKWTTAAERMAQAHDLIFCVRGSTTGRRVVSDGRYCIGRGVCAIRSKTARHQFLYKMIDRCLPRLLSKTTGSVFPSLSAPDIKNFRVLNPGHALMDAFEECVRPLDQRIALNVQQLRALTDLRDTLLPRLISGQLRLPEAADAIESALP